MGTRVVVLIGTRKGMFLAESSEQRRRWEVRGPYCEGRQTMDVNWDPAGGAIYAATADRGGNGLFEGHAQSTVWRSTDLGETWTHSNVGIAYGAGGPAIEKIWNVTPAHGAVYAGVEPVGLFRSDDGGQTWTHVKGLREHPSSPTWNPGNGGLCLHSVVVHPHDPRRIWVGTSAAGMFYTADGGLTWEPRNQNVRSFDERLTKDETTSCVHKFAGALNGRDLLYQQNHFGVYRSRDGGGFWEDVSAGLPVDFGFAFGLHPHDHQTIYVIPLQDDGRYMPEGKAAVYRSRDGGDSWTRQDRGLPQSGAYSGVLREGMALDTLEPAGVYFGTNTGQVFGSRDEGDSWALVADYLPPVLSVETAILER